MAGLVPAIHVFLSSRREKNVDAGHKAGHNDADKVESTYAGNIASR